MAETPEGSDGLDEAVVDRVPVGLFAIDRDWTIRLWNRSLQVWTGRGREEAMGRDARSIFPALAMPRHSSRIETLFEGGPPVVFSYELNAQLFVCKREGDRERHYSCVSSAMRGGAVVLFTVEDRTEAVSSLAELRRELVLRKAAEASLLDALKVKEMLVREASHRVMNNLTIIASLIGLESRRAQDDARCGFEELEARISSIALIHELLYKGEIGKEIWLDDYLERLCRSVFSTFLPADSPAKLELELAAVSLDVDDTLYLGLIVVELLTNSLKYAIIPRNGGLIRVSLRGLEEGWMELSVADDGPGIRLAADRGAAETSGDSLGQSLVSLLASEIGAELSRGNGPGTLVALLIPQKSK